MTFYYPTGKGRSDTRSITLADGMPNPARHAGEDYESVNLPQIRQLALNPPSVLKENGQWIIPSIYRAHDARSHEAQRQKGSFRFLTSDIDANNLELLFVDKVLSIVIGDALRIIYSSRSATEDNKKWRVLVPLAKPICGIDFAATQNAFFDLMEQASDRALVPDRALARPGQLIYLPNKGAFYQIKADAAKALDLTPDHAIMRQRDGTRAARAKAEAEAQAARERCMAERKAKVQADDVSPVDHFNTAHCVADLLARYGYTQAGSSKDWKSPFQSSGSYATRDFGEYWISLSASDAAQEIGAATKDGHRHGDAFDLFRHFEHRGDVKAAVRAYALDAGLGRQNHDTTATGQDSAPQVQDEGPRAKPEMKLSEWPMPGARIDMGTRWADAALRDEIAAERAVPEARPFEDILADAKALTSDDDLGRIEEITAEAAALNSLRQDHVFRVIKAATGIGLTALRQQLKTGAGPEPDHLDFARAAIASIGRGSILCAGSFVWRWDARGVWRQQDDRAIKQVVQATVDAEEADVTATLINGVTDVLKSEIFKPDHEFNLGNPETVNCPSGEIDLHAGQWVLHPHLREHYRTTQIPVPYDPAADAPLFRTFLGQVFRDDPDRADKIKALLELMGYTLMSHARHERFVMLIGPGANGKSVLLAILEALCGAANVAGVQPSNFDNRFQRAHLHQKLANIVTELKQGEVIADAELKAITSGEPATVEHKHKDPFVMRPFATCWFGTNHMPHTRDFSEALFRRATILQFNRTFATEEQDPTLKDKLCTELPGILNMALAAYGRAMAEGFTAPASSEEAKREWRLEADQVAQFVDDACQRDPAGRVPSSEVFARYKQWADQNGIARTMSQKGLRDRLTRLGFGAERDKHGKYVTSLRLVASW